MKDKDVLQHGELGPAIKELSELINKMFWSHTDQEAYKLRDDLRRELFETMIKVLNRL